MKIFRVLRRQGQPMKRFNPFYRPRPRWGLNWNDENALIAAAIVAAVIFLILVNWGLYQ